MAKLDNTVFYNANNKQEWEDAESRFESVKEKVIVKNIVYLKQREYDNLKKNIHKAKIYATLEKEYLNKLPKDSNKKSIYCIAVTAYTEWEALLLTNETDDVAFTTIDDVAEHMKQQK